MSDYSPVVFTSARTDGEHVTVKVPIDVYGCSDGEHVLSMRLPFPLVNLLGKICQKDFNVLD